MKWAWLLLDEQDNDPCRFSSALAAALTQIGGPFLDLDLRATLMPGAIPGLAVVAAIINNAIRTPEDPIALVIEDFHVIDERAVHQSLEYLIERLPPNMHVIVTSRYDPPIGLPRWRARGEIAELRLRDLVFTQEETVDLVSSCMNLELSPQELRALHSRTDGWAAGLRLLATSLAQSSERASLLEDGMEGRQRVFEFLAEEVLNRQTSELRRFLLDTSVATVLSKNTCDALTDRTDSDIVLADLYRRSLYVVAADEAGLHYRYHDLFAEFLRDRLRRERPQDWTALHDRVARIETDAGRRVHHWIAGGCWSEAAAEIERIGPDYLRRGLAFTVRRWILALPESTRREYPRLALLLGSAIWARNEFNLARPYFEEALEGFRCAGDEAAQGEALVALSITALNANETERAETLFEEALRFPLRAASCVELHAAKGWHAASRRDWPVVRRALDNLLDLMEQGDPPFDAFAVHLLFVGTSLPEITSRLERALCGIETRVESLGVLNRACFHMLRAACRLFHGDTAGARQASALATSFADRAEQPLTVRLYHIVVLALAAYTAGDWRAVEEISGELTDADSDALLIRDWRSMVAYFLGRARWLAGDASGLDECCRMLPTRVPAEAPHVHIHRLLLSGMRCLRDRAYARAEAAFREAAGLEQEHRRTLGHSNAAVLLAYTHWKRGDPAAALELFAPYAELAERLDGPGLLLRENPIVIPLLRLLHEKSRHKEFAERVLGMLGAQRTLAETTGREPLSAREAEVLRIMAEGLGNREIGKRLFVSEATVKTHVQRIIRKLDASSRTQAVARARERMLL
jgi:LuxR family maltose regulon positive regulatory protein